MLPKFSIRQLLLSMIVLALFSACLAAAARGSQVAFGISVSVFALIVPVLFFTVGFWLCYGIALVTESIFPNKRTAVTDQSLGPQSVVGSESVGLESVGLENATLSNSEAGD